MVSPAARRHRTAVIASRIFAPEVGAASARLLRLAVAFRDAGFGVRVLTSRPQPGSATPEDPPGVRVSRWPVLRDPQGIVRGYLQYLSFDLPLVVRLIGMRRPDVVVCEPPPTTGVVVRLLCGIRRVPYAYYAADVWSDGAASAGAPGVVVGVVRRLEAWVLRGACVVLSVSDGVTERLRALGVDPDRIELVGNGVDTDVFTPDSAAAAASSPYAVYAGTMSEWQGADIFVRAFAQVLDEVPQDARLVFLGQGSGVPELRRLAAELPVGRVELPGVVPAADAARWQAGAVCALVSIVTGQGYDFARPTKVWAATATGTPVLFAGTGPAAHQVDEAGLGQAVEYDVQAVARGLVRAFAAPPSPERRRELADWTREHASLAAIASRAVQRVRTSAGLDEVTDSDRGPSARA